jgi:NADPH:quinone reductase-like Zn-dependent oxidoreductase
LRPGGRYSSAGCIAGPLVEFDLRQLIYKDLQLAGATVVPPGTFARIVACIESGKVRPLLAATYPLAELAEAQEAFIAKRHVGNIVVTLE